MVVGGEKRERERERGKERSSLKTDEKKKWMEKHIEIEVNGEVSQMVSSQFPQSSRKWVDWSLYKIENMENDNNLDKFSHN